MLDNWLSEQFTNLSSYRRKIIILHDGKSKFLFILIYIFFCLLHNISNASVRRIYETNTNKIIIVTISNHGLCKFVHSIVNRGEFDLLLALLEL